MLIYRKIILFFIVAFISKNIIAEENILIQTEIPSIWPIKNDLGSISMFFGENINPFTGNDFFHTGINITTNRQGDPIVSTADGQVIKAEYDMILGIFVIISHKNEFYTTYAHMQRLTVGLGQYVQQGDIIGYIGNTGLSAEPHLHYQIHIGSDVSNVVDPCLYIKNR